MNIKLIFSRTCYDGELTAWTDTKEIEVDVPDWLFRTSNNWQDPQYHLLGMVMPEQPERKRG